VAEGGRLILHDLGAAGLHRADSVLAEEDVIFDAIPRVRPCTGCFGCWLRTPGICVIADRAQGFARLMGKAGELVVISRLVFGGLSPEVKAVLDRSIGHVLPFFTIQYGEMHHQRRYARSIALRYLFYGSNILEEERVLARDLVRANGRNFHAEKCEASFFASATELVAAL
jgi:multimeric flavodoxin WrbA